MRAGKPLLQRDIRMIPVRFPEANAVLGMNQSEYEPLPVRRFNDGRVAMCFRLSPAELEEIARTKTLWVQQMTFGHSFQPIALSTQRPDDLPESVEVIGVYIHRVSEELRVLIDYGKGPALLSPDGYVDCAGASWLMHYYRPRHVSRYRREVKPLPQPVMKRQT